MFIEWWSMPIKIMCMMSSLTLKCLSRNWMVQIKTEFCCIIWTVWFDVDWCCLAIEKQQITRDYKLDEMLFCFREKIKIWNGGILQLIIPDFTGNLVFISNYQSSVPCGNKFIPLHLQQHFRTYLPFFFTSRT